VAARGNLRRSCHRRWSVAQAVMDNDGAFLLLAHPGELPIYDYEAGKWFTGYAGGCSKMRVLVASRFRQRL
jgi:hypothetical protein